jgi:DNA-binding beta-propeller fold protein YncE
MPNRVVLLTCAIALMLPLPSRALQRAEVLSLPRGAVHAAADPESGRLFVAHAGAARVDASALSVVEPNGRVIPVVFGAGATHIALSARHRRAVAVHPATNQATMIDIDTLEARTVMTGIGPLRAVVAESRGFAYVIAKGPAAGAGSVTEIDLRSGFARTFPVPRFTPEDGAANAAGTRLFMTGTGHDSAPSAALLQSFDLLTRTAAGAPVPIGTMPRHILASAHGEEMYVVGHLARDGTLRRVLFVMDALDLATRRLILLPDARDPGRAALDAVTNQVYLLDPAEERLAIVDPVSADVRTIALEAPGAALAVNGPARRVIVSFDTLAQAGVFSMSGDRLDTLAIGRTPGAGPARHHIAVDGGSARAHVTNGPAGSVTSLRPAASIAPAAVDFTDLWFDPSRPGWGVFVDQQGGTIFATLFTHDAAGQPAWLFMSNGLRQPDGSFSGDLHRTRGPLAEALKNVTTAGSMRFEPEAGDRATLTYYVDGGLHTRSVRRFRLGEAPRDCRWQVDRHKAPSRAGNFTALWSNPADPGWGLAVSHQGDAIFAVLFTYDEQNRATWAVMPGGKLHPQEGFAGEVYRAVGERIEDAGHMSLSFPGADHGVLRYRLGGVDFRGPVIRQTFSRLTSRCAS